MPFLLTSLKVRRMSVGNLIIFGYGSQLTTQNVYNFKNAM